MHVNDLVTDILLSSKNQSMDMVLELQTNWLFIIGKFFEIDFRHLVIDNSYPFKIMHYKKKGVDFYQIYIAIKATLFLEFCSLEKQILEAINFYFYNYKQFDEIFFIKVL